jgi:hypothetical protein
MPLSTKLTGVGEKQVCTVNPPGFENAVSSIYLHGSHFNSANIGHLDANHFLPGTIPMFWWPLSMDLLESIYFQDFIVSTILNPASLVESLQLKGFNIKRSEKSLGFCISKKIDNHTIVLENLDYFLGLVQTCFYSVEAVIMIVERMTNGSITKAIQNPSRHTRVNLRLQQEPAMFFD